MKSESLNHQQLCEDLAAHMTTQGYRSWVEVKRVGQQSYGDRGRVDVLCVAPWTGRTKFSMIAFEVKWSRSDLMRDVQSGKWRRYADEYGIPSTVFAFPEHLASVAEIPLDAGVWMIRGDRWIRQRAPRVMVSDQRKLDPLLLLALVSQKPYGGYEAVARRRLAMYEAIPASVRNAIAALKDEDFADNLRYRVGRRMGHELAYRLAKPKSEVDKIHGWAEAMLTAVAEFAGISVEEMREQAARTSRGIEYDPIAKILQTAKQLDTERQVLHALFKAGDRLTNGYRTDWNKSESDRGMAVAKAVLADFEAAQREVTEATITRKRRKAAS